MSTTIYRVQVTTSPEGGGRTLYLTGDELDELGGFLDQLAAGPIKR